MGEVSYNVTLKLVHDDGIIKSARMLKSRSSLPEEILLKINNLFETTFSPKEETKTTVALGDLAEEAILAHFQKVSKYNSAFNVSDTSSMTGHGDMCVDYKDNRICIEVKNYTKPVPGKEIDKYHNSMNLDTYTAGIMVLMNDFGFAKEYKIRTPIDIKIVNGKPSAYLCGVDKEILYPIICILINMTETHNYDDIQSELDHKINLIKDIYNKTKDLKIIIETQKKAISKMEAMVTEMGNMCLL
jgi:hypothetical protein